MSELDSLRIEAIRHFSALPWATARPLLARLCAAHCDAEDVAFFKSVEQGQPDLELAAQLVERTLRERPEDEINRLYDSLAELAEARPARQEEYDAALSRLRALQEVEAKELARLCAEHQKLDVTAAERARAEAQRLLGEHEDPPKAD